MSTLDEVRERDAKYTVLDMKWSGTPEATKDRRFLLSQLDALQAECAMHEKQSTDWMLLAERNAKDRDEARAKLAHLQAAVKAAGPALEAAARYSMTERCNRYDNGQPTDVCDHLDRDIAQLRALLGLVI